MECGRGSARSLRRRSRTADGAQAQTVALPTSEGSLKFGVIGDFGTGNREQYQLGEQMGKLLAKFPYEMFITVGDNLYGSQRPQDFISKFEKPYKTLLDANVKFYASLGNHDDRAQARYKLFNMDGQAVLHLQSTEGGCPVLRAGIGLSITRTDQMAGERAAGFRREVEDSVLPSPAVFLG